MTVIDRTNHHVFQPLLYQVATATLAPTDIAAPIRWLLRAQKNTEVIMADVTEVDPDRRVVHCRDGRNTTMIFSSSRPGARHSYFGHTDWEERAPGLKSIEDAIELRRRWLLAFERAERTNDPAERAANLTFVIVGGGPTGVELAGMLPTIARFALPEDFRRIDTRRPEDHPARRRGAPAADVSRGALGARGAGSDRARRGCSHQHVRDQCRRGLRRDRRRAHRVAHDLLGGGQRGVVGRRIAGRSARQDGPRDRE